MRSRSAQLETQWGRWVVATVLSSLVGAAAGCSSILGFEDSSALASNADAGTVVEVDSHLADAGNGTNGQIQADAAPAARFAPVSIDFGAIDCASDSPDPLALTITNVGGAPLTWTAAIASGDAGPFHILGDTSGTVLGNDEMALVIGVDPLDDTVVSGQVDTATLDIKTNDPEFSDQGIQIQRTASGGQLVADKKVIQFVDGAADSGLQTQTFTVTNIGDRRVTMMGMLTADPSFDVSWPGGPNDVIFDGQDSLPFTVTYDPLHALGTPNAVTFDVAGPLCGDPPVVIVIPGSVSP